MNLGRFFKWRYHRILIIDTNILFDKEEIQRLRRLPNVCIPWAVFEEMQGFYWPALWRKHKGQPAEDAQTRHRDKKVLHSWPILYEMIFKQKKWELIGSRGSRRVPKIIQDTCLLDEVERKIWLELMGAKKNRRHGWRVNDTELAWKRVEKAIPELLSNDFVEKRVKKVIEIGWDVISQKKEKDKGQWWLESPEYVDKQLLEIFNPIGPSDVRILAAVLTKEEENKHDERKEIYLVTKDRYLKYIAQQYYCIDVIKKVSSKK